MLTSQRNAPGGIQSIDTLIKIVSGGPIRCRARRALDAAMSLNRPAGGWHLSGRWRPAAARFV
jgi:hypothetical protein